jgi:hypothetical protein
MAQSGLSIYQRNRTDRGWRYQRVEEGRGVKTGRIVGRFYVRPTQADGAQNWKPLTAESFEKAKIERDSLERTLAETTKFAKVEAANRTLLADAIESFLDQKRRKNASTVQNYTYILNEFMEQAGVRFVDEVKRVNQALSQPCRAGSFSPTLNRHAYQRKRMDRTRIHLVHFLRDRPMYCRNDRVRSMEGKTEPLARYQNHRSLGLLDVSPSKLENQHSG